MKSNCCVQRVLLRVSPTDLRISLLESVLLCFKLLSQVRSNDVLNLNICQIYNAHQVEKQNCQILNNFAHKSILIILKYNYNYNFDIRSLSSFAAVVIKWAI